jgi:hypothetical protein
MAAWLSKSHALFLSTGCFSPRDMNTALELPSISELRRQAIQFRAEIDALAEEGAPTKERIGLFSQLVGAFGQVIKLKLEREAYGIDKGNAPRDESERSIRVEIVSPQSAVRVEAR